ncbi:hypothetical protein EV188_101118 [Actinomycetospora succinea]|uniref:Uncharacterized protein n=1 Tax=Actinomycetospora succinea TaxID=663603 RepID=A0A4R6VR03_9PSEU|nr:hypothetical protein [Actinomycetospora succinea]TDQ64870.1 hypothetical protein EV188_101118 [Actinomycetospora succinea]
MNAVDRSGEEGALDRARARWRAAGDRVWAIAVVDGEEYRRLAERVGAVLDEVRAAAPAVGDLLALDADPGPVLGRAGTRAVLDAALAVRADELVAARARDERRAAIAAARASGERWVVLDASAGSTHRTVEMHLATGLALVATADPYAGGEPYVLGEAVLDTETGVTITDGTETSFADAVAWRDARARRRREIDSRLDGGDTMLSDK